MVLGAGSLHVTGAARQRIRPTNLLWANRVGYRVEVSDLPASVASVNQNSSPALSPEMNGAGGMYGLDDHIYQRLLRERIVFLGSEVRDQNANAICAQLLLLSAEDPEADIFLHINSPGGSVDAGMAIYDTMNYIPNDVATVGMGLAASMGQFLLCAGTKGKRYALPHARYRLVAATLTRSPRHPVGAVLGDCLVRVPSAFGRGRSVELFPGAETLHVPKADHFDLLNHPSVHDALRRWLA